MIDKILPFLDEIPEPATGLHLEPNESSPHPYTYFKIQININLSIPRSHKWSFCCTFFFTKTVYTFRICSMCPAHSTH